MASLETVTGRLGKATFCPCGRYRYHLTRGTPDAEHLVVFVMLNPSDANADDDDPTLGRCLEFAARSAEEKRWDAYRLAVVNLYAFVSKSPAVLKNAGYLIGPENDRFILETCMGAALVICGWGKHGKRGKRGEDVRRRLQDHGVPLSHLGPLNQNETPKHPSRLAAETHLRDDWTRTP